MYDKDSRNVILLAGIGAILEFYDFVLYMIFSKEISATFFAKITNPTIKAFLTVLIFSIAYLVRPFAGTILGIVGDLIGRRRLLLFTILLMGSCSLCMGLMPGYAQWGLYASFVFVLLRILQGIALGGELPGAYVIVYESVKGKIGFATAILFTFVTGGFLFSDFVGFALEYIFGDFAVGNILIKDNKLSGVIDFGGTAMGDPACDLVIAWTYLSGKARDIFVSEMGLDDDTWLRARAWVLWKATFELCNITDKSSPEALLQKNIIDEVINE
ncbi:MFS transporter [Francisella sp. SYW-2]|uniref:MFS transporter n=1 Tax=Francisella sp. SYW-2 TaxID=2610886 RepID=UPI00123D59CA|nr:MFS transporter [Francisella sp. SYW-2]